MTRLALLGALLVPGCGGAGPPPASAPASQPAAVSAPGEKTTLRGVARDAKGGAVVVTAGGPVYVLGLDAWPPQLAGRTIEITGLVRRQKHLPDPVGPDGTLVQGARGEQAVITEATWRAVE